MQRRLITLVILLGSSIAHAQRAPDMATLDRGDGITKFGLDLGFSSLEKPPYSGALRFDLYGQYVTESGIGIYGDVPLSLSFGSDGPPDPDNATSLNNIDLGLLYVLSGDTLSWVFRAGVGLPTSSDGLDESATRYYATTPRLTDIALASNDWHLRLSVSPLVHIDRLFLRADIGFDIHIGEADDNHYLRLNVGGGVDLGPVALSLELVNLSRFGDFDRDEDFFHAFALTLRFMGERFQPFLSFGLPIDDYRRDRVHFFVSGGVQVAF
jgi:hypothetical protein